MTTASLPTGRAGERAFRWALALWGCGAATLLGVAIGWPSSTVLTLAGVSTALTLWALAFARPFWAFMLVAASMIVLVVLVLPVQGGLNPVDFLLPPIVFMALFGGGREEVAARTAAETGERHALLHEADRRLTRAVCVYYGWAWLSTIQMVVTGRWTDLVTAVYALVRAIEGVLLYPLGKWFLSSERRIRLTMGVLCASALVLLGINILHMLFMNVPRAGITWYVNQPDWPIASPNEAGAAMAYVVAIVMVLHATRPRWHQWLIAGGALVMLVLTSSRSGLLAFLTFMAFRLPRFRWSTALIVVLVLAAGLPLVPEEYWERMWKTMTTTRGTWEAYGTLTRLLTWATAVKVFLHHPLIGVGYLGLEGVSSGYNDLRIHVGAESYFLEMAADLGLVGVIALGFVLVRLFRLGRAVREVSPPGSLGWQMAAVHTPLVVCLLVACLTGSNLIGMIGIGQIALWSAMMVRAGHAMIDAAGAPGEAPAEGPLE